MGETRVSAKAIHRLYPGAAKWEIISAPVDGIGDLAQSGRKSADWCFSRQSSWISSSSQPGKTTITSSHRPAFAILATGLGSDIFSACTYFGSKV